MVDVEVAVQARGGMVKMTAQVMRLKNEMISQMRCIILVKFTFVPLRTMV